MKDVMQMAIEMKMENYFIRIFRGVRTGKKMQEMHI